MYLNLQKLFAGDLKKIYSYLKANCYSAVQYNKLRLILNKILIYFLILE